MEETKKPSLLEMTYYYTRMLGLIYSLGKFKGIWNALARQVCMTLLDCCSWMCQAERLYT